MSRDPVALLTPRILVVDDERQIHASLRLRLERDYDLAFCFSARDALDLLQRERFDLCFADIHMPQMDGLTFVETAQKTDPELGYVVLSAFDTDENLRRTIPLQVYDFVPKPLPDRDEFEARIPEWIAKTRHRRRERELAEHAGDMVGELDSARLEREVELVASEAARDALLQTASLLTTIHAHLVTAVTTLAPRARSDHSLNHLLRQLDEARKTADAAATVAEGFFDSAYGSRDTSPALVDQGLRHAIEIAARMSNAEHHNKTVDAAPLGDGPPLRGLTGIDFLLLMIPGIAAALAVAAANTTVRLEACALARLDLAGKDARLKSHLWFNRRNASISQPGVLLTIAAAGPAFSRAQAEAWFSGEATPLAKITARGLVLGVQKAKGLLGLAIAPSAGQFHLALALPV